MPTATLRFYAELNDLLPSNRRGRDSRRALDAPTPARHLIESCGVPHTEVGRILCDGVGIDLETRLATDARLSIYPADRRGPELPDSSRREKCQERHTPRFIADAHLGALARRLRMLGFDTLWENDIGDAVLARQAAEQRRILLSRDRALLMRRQVSEGCYIRQQKVSDQLRALIERLRLCDRIAPFTRCMRCNGLLQPLSHADAQTALPPSLRGRQLAVWRCAGCGRAYWRGSHWQAMRRQIQRLCPDAADRMGLDPAARTD
ncbi:Mut7-C RNAse domain-containing protein [Thiorhodococcus minor]|uniref:Twitching motility protein PilT n=1 Tax=Thiorhodococcus minor TaxID=57489 RepID=A0A6M0K3U2_9GAMM|nr:Mut7-C RNAse domain-containing protein [Thiorhodococcus minor]NEV64446.1 twitching motility protein PilT [Thiorhodococcus minor]